MDDALRSLIIAAAQAESAIRAVFGNGEAVRMLDAYRVGSGLKVSLHALVRAREQAERHLLPKLPGESDFQAWLREGFHADGEHFRVEQVAYPVGLTRSQAMDLAIHVGREAGKLALGLADTLDPRTAEDMRCDAESAAERREREAAEEG